MTRSILVFGSAHIERTSRLSGGTTVAGSNPGKWFEEPGGGAFNAARVLSRLGHAVRMISLRGGDAAGETIARAAEAAGIDDRPVVFLDRATSSHTEIRDAGGDLVIAVADMDLYRFFTPRRLRIRAVRDALDNADMLLCDAHLQADTLEALAACAAERGIPLAAIGISPTNVTRLKGALPALSWLFLNAAEAEALAGTRPDHREGWPDLLRPLGLRSAVVVDGDEIVIAYDDHLRLRLVLPAAAGIARDDRAWAGGILSALAEGLPLNNAVRMGASVLRLPILSENTEPDDLAPYRLQSQLHLTPEPEILA